MTLVGDHTNTSSHAPPPTHTHSISKRYLLVCLFEIYRAASILKTVAQVATDIPPGAAFLRWLGWAWVIGV